MRDGARQDGLAAPCAAPIRWPPVRGAIGAGLIALAGCTQARVPAPVLEPLPPVSGEGSAATARVNGSVGTPQAVPPAQVSTAAAPNVFVRQHGAEAGATGNYSLDFADTDIREAVAQILGNMLHVNYTIDPAVHGTVTLRTTQPLTRAELLPTLQTLLAENGATLLQSDSLYRVVTITAAAANPALAGSEAASGATVVPLHYASSEDLAKVLQPFIGSGGKIIAVPGSNSLLVTADPSVRETLVSLIQAFDVDALAGQSYALLPVTSGSVRDFASALQDAFRGQSGGALAGVVRVIPMERVSAVLVVSAQPSYIDDARRVYDMVTRAWQATVRSWHVYYLQNSSAEDAAYVLQQAFTPGNVTARPSGAGQTAPGRGTQQAGSGFGTGLGGGVGGGLGTGGIGGGIGTGGIGGGTNLLGGATGTTGLGGGIGTTGTAGTAQQPAQSQAAANPLLGPLESGGGAGANGQANAETMRIIPNDQNNAVLIYATPREEDTVEAMLRKIDILPLQVRIDATIAEVTLNDQLQFGTQYYFKHGGLNAVLSNASESLPTFASAALGTTLPGFVIGGSNAGAQFAISALQAVTTVHVLSSPEILVLDNQPARLQVGDLVPYLSQTAQSTITSTSDVVNSVEYQPTGVIMQVTPRVNSSGLVTLDVDQEVSNVDTTVSTTGLNSPTFSTRNVSSRVVVQDGQTLGLAGLISDTITRGNTGIPILKDIPLLSFLTGQQGNTRTRTELLVLITPHVMHDQHEARELTEDLREQLINAAGVPAESRALGPSGAADPTLNARRRLGLPQ